MYEKAECSVCLQIKTFKFLKTVPRGNWTKDVYVDETGRPWLYKKCPTCHGKVAVRKSQRKLRRKCLSCGKGLETNYFYHTQCLARKEQEVGYESW